MKTKNKPASTSLHPALRLLGFLLALGTAQASSVVPPEFTELVNESDYIVRAVVKSVTAEERTMPSGSRMIFSKIELEVTQVIAGQPPARLVLQVLGGQIGDRELSIAGAPKFAAGEESIFFVQGNGRQIYPLVRMMHGLYHIRKEAANGREYLSRSNGEPLRHVDEISRPIVSATAGPALPRQLEAEALSPADFVLKIRATATKPALREH